MRVCVDDEYRVHMIRNQCYEWYGLCERCSYMYKGTPRMNEWMKLISMYEWQSIERFPQQDSNEWMLDFGVCTIREERYSVLYHPLYF